jgi:hypothetical protein
MNIEKGRNKQNFMYNNLTRKSKCPNLSLIFLANPKK